MKATTRHRILTAKEVRNVPRDLLPAIVLTDNLESFLAWRIRSHTHGAYNHACWMHEPGRLASQGWTLEDIPVDDYLTARNRVKIWVGKGWGPAQRTRVYRFIKTRLRLPRRKRLYDWPGVIGQALGLPWLQIPGRRFCSEDVADGIRQVDTFLNKRPSPEEINVWLKQREWGADPPCLSPLYQVYGVYDPDLVGDS